jgi:hypothetical protein
MQTRFDAYTATTRAAKAEQLITLAFHLGDRIREGRGHHGFEKRYSLVGQDGDEAASISIGGTHGDRAMLEVKGERTPDVVEKLRASFEHRCTRVDSCYDVEQDGAFEAMLIPTIEVKKQYRIKGGKAGDWDDFPEEGRTQYVGAGSSACKARLYEKGLQPEYRHLNRPNWVRLELQVRPEKQAKETYSTASPLEVWGASKWTRDLAGRILQAKLEPLPAGTTYKLSEQERKLRFMCKQYGAAIMQLADDLGSWDLVGPNLQMLIKAEIDKRSKGR